MNVFDYEHPAIIGCWLGMGDRNVDRVTVAMHSDVRYAAGTLVGARTLSDGGFIDVHCEANDDGASAVGAHILAIKVGAVH